METKICKKCDIENKLDYFRGRLCKECIKEYHRQYRKNNIEKICDREKLYRKNNIEKIKEYNKLYHNKNKDRLNESKKKYYNDNSEYLKEISKIYQKNNREKINNRHKNRMLNEPLYKTTTKIRKLILVSLKNCGYRKQSKTYEILGCSFEDFKIYIEKQFESWMNWNNWGTYTGNYNETWHIDHIIPLYNASNEEEVIRLNHYTNLRPLCSRKNLERLYNKNPDL